MDCDFRYGIGSSASLQVADAAMVAQCGLPKGDPIHELGPNVRAALAEPLDYPSLALSTTPSDRIVVALEHGVPRAAEIVAAVVGYLVDHGVAADGLTVLQTQADLDAGADDPCRLLPAELQQRVTTEIHEPTDREKLAYLAANEAGDPILLNRTIHDADLVLPVGCMHGEHAPGYFGTLGAIYPTFSDDQTLHRYRGRASLQARRADRRRLDKQVDEVGWLLGISLALLVVPGAGDDIQQIVAGHYRAVERRGRELYGQAWTCRPPRRAELVVAAIEGGPVQQTWWNVGRALCTAAELVEDGGAIAVCCDLQNRPGPGVQRLMGEPSQRTALKQINQQRPADALPAMQLAETLANHRIYLLSRLDEETVEDLDMIPLASPDELGRLVGRAASCTIVSNATRAVVAES
jgi:nickel-dependent lactate racemase